MRENPMSIVRVIYICISFILKKLLPYFSLKKLYVYIYMCIFDLLLIYLKLYILIVLNYLKIIFSENIF